LEGGNQEEINKKVEELTEEETIEYAALSDLAFLHDWDKRFNKTLLEVSTMKQELIKNERVVKIDADGEKIFGPIGFTTHATMLNSITRAEHKIYLDKRKNLNLADAPEEPDEPEYSEKVDNTLFNKKLSEGFNLDAVED